jgi:hypothetical protein
MTNECLSSVEEKRLQECERKIHERGECRGSPWCRYCNDEQEKEEK